MRKVRSGLTVSIVCAGLLWAGAVAAAPGGEPGPPDGNPSQGGGNNQCRADLAACQAATCGNGVAEFGEECDGANLQGATCDGFLFGTVTCSATCTVETSGCTDDRFVANGDGTITDNQTGLTWEKKTDDSTIHDVDDLYKWSVTGTAPDGEAFTVFLNTLNTAPCFAGHCDWRLPRVDMDADAGRPELETILDCSSGSPCIDPIFGPTVASGYWSTTTNASNFGFAWGVSFSDGNIFNVDKMNVEYVRAVRTGP